MKSNVIVPAGTPSGQCRSCRACIYWVPMPSGKKNPIDCDISDGKPPTDRDAGQGVSHFATCPHGNQHRKK